MTNRQTASFLIRRFKEAGIHPVTRRGQNFLVDLNLLHLLVDTANLTSDDVVLEVGTGLGSLTALAAERAAAVVTVEVDAHLQQLAAEQLYGFSNVTMLRQDALKNKNRMHPNVIAALDDALQQVPGRDLKLVANLPFNIATPVVSNMLSTDVTPVSMTVTIQKELADRITARPGTKDYSALSVWIQSQCDTRVVRTMPPEVFWPRPKVQSAIVQVLPQPEKRSRIPNRDYFHSFARAMFFHRRKLLRSELLSAFKQRITKPEVDNIMADLGLGPQTRAEQLDVATLLVLSEAMRTHLGVAED